MGTADVCTDALDRTDPLRHFRDHFQLPDGTLYLDGNSLGVLPKAVPARVAQTVTREWGDRLIASWAEAGWVDLPTKVGARIARLIGANASEVIVGDSTSVNLFKCLAAALKARPDRTVILTEEENFPTDNYIAQGIAALLGGYEIRYISAGEDPCDAIDDRTAVVLLTHVNYRTAAIHDMPGVTRKAHAMGALTIWDLSHSAGALEVDLAAADADFAVGCTYKYLNGGPGAPSYLFASSRLIEDVQQPLSGWFGHRDPFAFDLHYAPADAARRFLCGTPQILSLAALDASLDIWDQVDMALVRDKSTRMTSLFIDEVDRRLAGHGLTIVSPRTPDHRGSHVSIESENGYPIIRALADHGLVGDFREPGLMRFGFTPLYLSYGDVVKAVDILEEVLIGQLWTASRYSVRLKVT